MSLAGRHASARFGVVAGAGDVRAFAASIGADPTAARLPTTYPIRWLTRPEVVALVKALSADMPMALPVHELQTVETFAALPIDTPLSIEVTATRTDAIHVTLEASVTDAGNQALVRLRSVLRLFQ
ncbi:hypothetical protein [Phreatobacter stygius]|uniref:Uncharacterized protein n=1 Tax=Phreatobacter stygius TaxID=1940610 RepID=A0A4D7B026_9HYPH|nr:hypothetical protein [Phreatobacter stygius]QCI66021.1 hypothetical protein E8M01_18480 [Phreatobacter stygius]